MSRPDLDTAPAPKRERDPRIDAFRGLALLMIFVDHVPGNPYEYLTIRNLGFSDAAEAFFIMSGIAAGMAYSGGFARKPFLAAAEPVWKRAWTLYLAHILLTFWGIAIFAAGAQAFGLPELLEKNNLRAIFERPEETLAALPALLHQIGYVNILPAYSVLLLATPFAVVLGMRRPYLLAGLSVGLWLVTGLWRLNLPNHPNPGGWFFNPFAWQILFVAGLLTGIHARKGTRFVPVSRTLFWLALGWLALVLAWRYVPGVGTFLNHQMAKLGAAGLPFHFVSHDKTFVAVPRMLHALALFYVLSCLPQVRALSGLPAAAPLRLLGKHGLLVFSVGTLTSLALQVLMAAMLDPEPMAWLVLPLGLAIMLGVAWIAERRKQGTRNATTEIVPQMPPAAPVRVRS